MISHSAKKSKTTERAVGVRGTGKEAGVDKIWKSGGRQYRGGGGGGLHKIAEIRTPLPTMIEKCCLISLNVELIELFLLLTFVNLYVFLGIPINPNFLSWVVA